MSVHSPIQAVAIDFAGTLTLPKERRRPTGPLVQQVLLQTFGLEVPESFAPCYDRSMWRWYEESLPDSFAELLAAVADDQGVRLPGMDAVVNAVWEATGDHPIDPAAAEAVRALHGAGLTCLLASNTCRPRAYRARTLTDAGLSFMIPVCSSDIGAAKPDVAFYDRVIELANVAPAAICFLGDNMHRDVVSPIHAGMAAAHVNTKRDAGSPPERMADGTLVLSRLSQLTVDLLQPRTR
ncbi:HAD family hydrolase [Streptomyces sp. MP131-18]|uniref:HAD family hydrolase n=1 Tax=Streptomyces sp. MP131-18 TaxID=1857892 RepID=UPI0009A19085|nr:HAD family hydrolase [Streptomyces sp. MP131-18]ONK13205.1 dUMP phosphatase [Streptomyces sp. MP131-18]